MIRGTALQKIDEYIFHRKKREEEIYNVLKSIFLDDKFEYQNYRDKKILNDGRGKISNRGNEKFYIRERLCVFSYFFDKFSLIFVLLLFFTSVI